MSTILIFIGWLLPLTQELQTANVGLESLNWWRFQPKQHRNIYTEADWTDRQKM